MWKNLKNSKKGITLIALVITVIVLLILASVSIAMLTGDNGILTRAGDVKIETAVGAVKEQIGLYQIEKKMDNKEVTPENLLVEGKVSRTVQLGEADKYYMYYALKDNSFEGMQGLGKGNIASLKDVFLIDDNLNVKYISTNGKEYGDTLNNKVLDDETEIRFSSKAFSEYVSKISGVTEEEMKFKWMKNQTSLVISNIQIENLQDLIFFPNLTKLSISNMTFENLNGIENCINIQGLEIIDVRISNYDAISYLKDITSIYVQGSIEIKNFIDNIKNLYKLKNLSLYATYLNDQDVKLLEELKDITTLNNLNLGANNIKNITFLKSLVNLEILDLRNNQIENIFEISYLSKLKSLNLSNNNIMDITPLANNEILLNLYLKGNKPIKGKREEYTEEELSKIDEIGKILDRGGNIYLDKEQLNLFKNYKNINLSYQNLTSLEVLDGMTQLESLNLSNNKITLKDEMSKKILSSMTNLKFLFLTNNEIEDASAINELTNLKILYIEGNSNINLKEIENVISNLDNLRLDDKTLSTINNCDPNKIKKLIIDHSITLTQIPELTNLTNLKTLHLENLKNVKDFYKISNYASLKNLKLTLNNMHNKMLDFSKLTQLEILSMNSCSLWSEDLENLKALKNNTNLTINLSNNSIIDATALLELNSNTKINLSNNVNLSQDSKDKLKAKFGNNVTF